jgi:hypothetical protein
MRKLFKILIGLAAGVLILIIAGVIILILSINHVARRGVEAGGSYALGVPTTLKGATIGILGGTVQLNGLHVANAPGFPNDHFLTLGDAKVAVKLNTLMSDTIYIPELTLDTIDVALEKNQGKANYDVILGNLQKLSGPPDTTKPPQPPAPKEAGKKLVIHQLTIRKVNVHADLIGAPGVLGKVTKVNVPIGEIKLTDVGGGGQGGVGGSGVTIGELSGLVVQAVLSAAVETGGLPGEFVGDLKGHISKLGDLAGGAGKLVATQAGATVKVLGEQAGKIGEQVGGSVKEGVGKLGEGLKGIIPKQPEKKK